MEEVCPVCNGLEEIEEICPVCGYPMEHKGKREDYFGPYSPYIEQSTVVPLDNPVTLGDQQCIHIMECNCCGNTDFKSILLKMF